MHSIAVYGAGGFGREVKAMLELSSNRFAGFIDDYKQHVTLQRDNAYDDVLMAIADTAIRSRLVDTWNRKPVPFAPFISEDVRLHPSVSVGNGCIICPGVKMTSDVVLGRFVIVNLNATIGHDVVAGDFTSIMPSVNISGNVKIGERAFIGSGATILQGLEIGDGAVIGAGAVVTHNVRPNAIVFGVPAKPK